MRYTVKAQTIPDGDPVAGARVTLTRQDDGIVAATGTTDVDGWCTLTANGAPGNVFIEVLRGSDRWRDDSRAMRPYGQFSPAEWADTAQEVCGDGVVPYGTAFALTAGTGSVTIGTGAALLHGVLGVWDTSTILPVSSGARACAVLHSGSGRLQLVDVAQADLTSDHLTLYTYNVSGGTITGVVRVAAPILEGIMTKHATLQAVVRASTGDTSNASGEASGNEITFDLESGVTYDIEATASVITREREGAIAIEIDGNLSDYAGNGADITTAISNSHARSKTGGSCLVRLFERSDTLIADYLLKFGSDGTGNDNFRNPGQMVRDASDNLYIVDGANARIKKHSATGSYIGAITGFATQPRGVAVDASGNIYTSECGSGATGILRKFNSSFVEQWQVTGLVLGLAAVSLPLATDGTHVWIPQNIDTVKQYRCSDGALIDTINWPVPGGIAAAEGMVADSQYLYVADAYFPSVFIMDKSTGALVLQWTNSPGRNTGIALHPGNGNVLVTKETFVGEYTTAGSLVRTFGAPGSGDGKLNGAAGIVLTADGSGVYVVDTGNDRVTKFAYTGAFPYNAAVLFARAIPR